MSEPRILDEAHRIKKRLEGMSPRLRHKALAEMKRKDPLMAKVVAIVCGNGPHASVCGKLRRLPPPSNELSKEHEL